MREPELKNILIGIDLVYNYDLVANDIYGKQIPVLIGDKSAKLKESFPHDRKIV